MSDNDKSPEEIGRQMAAERAAPTTTPAPAPASSSDSVAMGLLQQLVTQQNELIAKLIDRDAAPAPKPDRGKPTPGTGAAPTSERSFDGPIDPLSLSAADVARLRNDGRLIEVMERWRMGNRPGSAFGRKRRQ